MAGEEESKNKSFKLLGFLDVQKMPCSREAILHGAGGSVAAGLLHFLATSFFLLLSQGVFFLAIVALGLLIGRVKRSFDVGFAGFLLTTLGSWFYCRMNNAKIRVQQRQIQKGIQNKVVYEGTVLDPTNKPRPESPSGSS